jgi:hypothetical protein
LACKFTVGELAALRIVADEVREKGNCDRTLGEIAARAGIGRTTAQNAMRLAAARACSLSRNDAVRARRTSPTSSGSCPGSGSSGSSVEGYRVQKNRPHGQRIQEKRRKRHSPGSL